MGPPFFVNESIRGACEHTFDALGQPPDLGRRGPNPAWLPRAGRRPALRRARGDGHAVLRGPRQVSPQPRARAIAHAVPLDDQCLQRMQSCLHLLRMGRNADPHGRRRTKPLANLRASGTRSTEPSGRASYRRYAVTRVLAHWKTRQVGIPGQVGGRHGAHRERRPPLPQQPWLEACDRGRAGSAPAPAPHRRTTSSWGWGASPSAPADSPEYRRGYLCGLIRGDGSIGSLFVRPART